ncbi:MAG: phosphotransferase [Chloroflexota bacterium]|nr:phosphotransferase [Chloroflexota bacterium]
MMKLSTMWTVDQTYDTNGRSEIAEAIANRWTHDRDSVRSFRSSANFINVLTRDGRPAFLRFAADTERSLDGIRQELDVLARFHCEGLPVVQVVPSRSGSRIETVETSAATFHAVLFDGLEGRHLDIDDLDIRLYREWGGTVGRLHAVFAQTPPFQLRAAPSWEVALDTVEADGSAFPDVIVREVERLRGLLRSLPRDAARYGLIHRDLEMDNLVWDGKRFAILDFDEFSQGWFMFDIAKALSEPLDAGLSLASPELDTFLTGYREHKSITDEDLSLLSDFRSLSTLLSYIAVDRALDIGAEEAPVTWLRDLIRQLEGWKQRYEDSIV